jgi:ATP phosphoribosyltransferase
MGDTLIIAVPSKGRLQENAAAFFARAGLPLRRERGERDYSGRMGDLADVEVHYLSASEIAARLSSGDAHLGVTGEDLVRETIPRADERVLLLAALGFGQANVVVAVPRAWIDAESMADLEEIAAERHARLGERLRIATKYLNLTRRFFAEKGVTDYRIVESLGATEGAPAAGTADAIVDITTTGSTLAANGLKVLSDGVILRSEAHLTASLAARWSDGALGRARLVLGRITAERLARTTRDLTVHAGPDRRTALAAALKAAGGEFLATAQGGAFAARVPATGALAAAESLLAAGATSVALSEASYVFEASNPLFDQLLRMVRAPG